MIKDTVLQSEYKDMGKYGRLLAFESFPKGLLKVVYAKEREVYFIISVIWAKKIKTI